MILLFSPLISSGITHPAGTVIMLDPAFEKRIVENGNAEYVVSAQPEKFPESMYQQNIKDDLPPVKSPSEGKSASCNGKELNSKDEYIKAENEQPDTKGEQPSSEDLTKTETATAVPSGKIKPTDPNQTVFGRGAKNGAV